MKNLLIKLAIPIAMLLFGDTAFAGGPQVCSAGYFDSTCLTPLTHAPVPMPAPCPSAAGWITVSATRWIGSNWSTPACSYVAPPPGCSTAAGWTTIAGATWNGSTWSTPVCNYQGPPSCPYGYTQAVGPSWNGSAWVGLVCQQPAPPTCPSGYTQSVAPTWNGSAWVGQQCNPPPAKSTPGEQESACLVAYENINLAFGVPKSYTDANFYSPANYGGPMVGPLSGVGTAQMISEANNGSPAWGYFNGTLNFVDGPAPTGQNDMYHAGNNYCFFQPGTTTLISLGGAGYCSYNGGSASCGGGGMGN